MDHKGRHRKEIARILRKLEKQGYEVIRKNGYVSIIKKRANRNSNEKTN